MAKAQEELREILTVTELTRRVKELLEEEFPFVWVVGEVSDLRGAVSGHSYFVLKDEDARLRSVIFRNQARYLGFDLDDGLEVVARGRLTIYEPRGEYQLVIDHLEPKGLGLIALSLERLKARLAAEGLFDPRRRRPLPTFPHRVVVVTSPVGAAKEDFVETAHSRYPGLEILVYPARVQGEGAAFELAQGIRAAAGIPGVDIVVLTRGGGSFEDLLPFSEEVLVRAVADSEIPVVSAVGHEIDTTLADLAADYRAATPTGAAVAITEGWYRLRDRLPVLAERLAGTVMSHVYDRRVTLGAAKARLKDPTSRLMDLRLRALWLSDGLRAGLGVRLRSALDFGAFLEERLKTASPAAGLAGARRSLMELSHRTLAAARGELGQKRARMRELAALLSGLSPLEILSRGYSIVLKLPDRVILKESGQVKRGESVEVVLSKGRIECRVAKVEP